MFNLELNQMKQFLVYFWTKRNPADAVNAWSKYENEVKKGLVLSCQAVPTSEKVVVDFGV